MRPPAPRKNCGHSRQTYIGDHDKGAVSAARHRRIPVSTASSRQEPHISVGRVALGLRLAPGASSALPHLSDTTPAMAAGVTDHAWKLEEIVGLLDHANAA